MVIKFLTIQRKRNNTNYLFIAELIWQRNN